MNTPRILCVLEKGPKLDELRSELEHAGYEVVRAYTGAEALDLLGSEHLDGVVLDYQIQTSGGVSLRNRIRRVNPDMPILLFSELDEIKSIPLDVLRAYLRNPGPPESVLAGMSR